ncbi:MoaD/ThiS family protein [Geitlerinema sp. P-1104]|uniref:MoaD/ThiS family protein n=1 Tax=Geitlerinema sp. P-1104 TaxID=2546230 RepID=UPI0014776BAE|nr:MoaD/ThiS family protein [Geitlerinema sp. P-1104]NMG59881.1 MoaD/ThiS family protein [Geitlerinema sp. P-1104]
MTPSDSITIVIKLFAAYQEAYQTDELIWQVAPNSTVATVLDRCMADHPNLAPWRDRTRFGINLEFVEPDTLLHDGDEVVLIPPVSGG